MAVAVLTIRLELPDCTSLKDKRSRVKPILTRLHKEFNISAAEVDLQDMPGTAILAFVTVSEDRSYARRVLERIEEWLVEERPDLELVAVEIEER